MPIRFRFLALITGVLLTVLSCSYSEHDVFQGYLEADYVYVASPAAGQLKQLFVERGQQVTIGSALFALDPQPENLALAEAQQRTAQAQFQLDNLRKGKRPTEIAALEARVAQTQADYDLSVLQLRRQEQLLSKKINSVEDVDKGRTDVARKHGVLAEAKADLETNKLGAREDEISAAEAYLASSEAALDKAKWMLEQKSQLAAVVGTVFDTYYRPGEWVAAGKPVVSILPPQYLKIRFFVPEQLRAKIQPNSKLTVRVDGLSAPLPAAVTYLSAQAEFTPPVIYSSERREKLVFLAEGKFTEQVMLQPGQPVEIELR